MDTIIKVVGYEEARSNFLKAEMERAENRMKFWRTKIKKAQNAVAEMEAHNNASNAGWEYNFYKDALEALENQPKWISIKEQLPTRELRVLTINGHGLIRIFGFFKRTEKAWTWIDDAGHFNHCNDITHWMPLPSTEGIE